MVPYQAQMREPRAPPAMLGAVLYVAVAPARVDRCASLPTLVEG